MNKKQIFFIITIFSIIASFNAKASFLDDLAIASQKMIDFTAQKALDLTIKNLPKGVNATYDKLEANIVDNFFILYNIDISVEQNDLKSHIKIGEVEVKDVDVVKALSGTETPFGKASFSDIAIKDFDKNNSESTDWIMLAKRIQMTNLALNNHTNNEKINPDNAFLTAEKLEITNLNATKKRSNNTTKKIDSEDYKAANIQIDDLKLRQDVGKKINSVQDVVDNISFKNALVEDQKITDILTLFKTIKTR
ncbi:MAG: hypothetical protein AB7U85_10145 [Alphaproteobacteria bacterium]